MGNKKNPITAKINQSINHIKYLFENKFKLYTNADAYNFNEDL